MNKYIEHIQLNDFIQYKFVKTYVADIQKFINNDQRDLIVTEILKKIKLEEH